MDAPVRVAREPQRSRFDRIAEAISQFVSRGAFFTASLVAVVIWMPTIVLFSSVGRGSSSSTRSRLCWRSC
jgi:uncharacterized membrane protein